MMRCNHCGKEMPMQGKVCPYCEPEKDRLATDMTCMLIGGFVGTIWGVIHGHWSVGGVVGIVAGAFVALVINYFVTGEP